MRKKLQVVLGIVIISRKKDLSRNQLDLLVVTLYHCLCLIKIIELLSHEYIYSQYSLVVFFDLIPWIWSQNMH